MVRPAAALLLLTTACVITPHDSSGKPCPCSPGFLCDDGRCVACPSGESRDDPSAAIHVTSLKAEWATPNQMRWRWAATGTAAELRGYSLIVGTSAADVRACTGSATLWTASQNPELGRFLLPRTIAEDQVLATTVDRLDAGTEYFAKLVAADTSGRLSVSNIAGQRTGDPPVTRNVVLLRDSCPAPNPPGYELTTAKPYAGAAALRYQLQCGAAQTECYENLSCSDPALTSLPDLTPGRFANAFFEVAVADESTLPSYWSNLGIGFGQGCAHPGCLFFFDAWTLPATGDYRLLQVPLRAFVGADGGPMTAADTAPGVYQFMVGAGGPTGTVLHVDEARVRY